MPSSTPQRGWRKALKAACDRSFAAIALVALSPLMALIALLIRVSMGAPVLFTQWRPGYRAQLFKLYKFRTMTDACDAGGQRRPDQERLTRLGRILRATSLDELPQLINVLRGELSLVGPRPLLTEYLPLYTPTQARRHDVLPGITGWAQVHGRNAVEWEERLERDAWYVDHWSLRLDLQILAQTFAHVFRRKGISYPGHETMPEFTGSPRVREQK